MNQGYMVVAAITIWAIAVVFTAAGRAGGRDFFVPGTGDWCEISQKYEAKRLRLHYFWLFLDAVCDGVWW